MAAAVTSAWLVETLLNDGPTGARFGEILNSWSWYHFAALFAGTIGFWFLFMMSAAVIETLVKIIVWGQDPEDMQETSHDPAAPSPTADTGEQGHKPLNIGWIGGPLTLMAGAFFSYIVVEVFMSGNSTFDEGISVRHWPWHHYIAFVIGLFISWMAFVAVWEWFKKLFEDQLNKPDRPTEKAKTIGTPHKQETRHPEQAKVNAPYIGWQLSLYGMVAIYVLIHATFVSSLYTWGIAVSVMAVAMIAAPLLWGYISKLRKFASLQSGPPPPRVFLFNFMVLILLGSPIILLATGSGGERWWMLQDILPYRSETLVNVFAQFADFQPRPTVSAAKQLAFEDYLNGQ